MRLHDRAFDCGLMYLDQELKVRYRPELTRRPASTGTEWLLGFEGKPISVPRKFRPDLVLVEAHTTLQREF